MRLSGLIFDLDGTLIDNLAATTSAIIRAFDSSGHPGFTHQDVVAMFGPSEDGMLRSVVGDAWESCWKLYCEHYQAEIGRLRPPAGMQELLAWIDKEGLRQGMVTGRGEQLARLTLEAMDLRWFGSSVRFGSPGGSLKRECIQDLIRLWGLAPEQAAYIGDAPSDMRIALDAGVVPLGAAWFDTAGAGDLLEAGAVAVFRTPHELKAWLRAA